MSTAATAIEAWGDMFSAFESMIDSLPEALYEDTRVKLADIGRGLADIAPTSVHRNEVLTLCARHQIRLYC